MQAITVSFVHTEEDVVDSLRHVARHGSQLLFTLLSPLVVALACAAAIWNSFGGWPGVGMALVPVGIGLLLLSVNWYVAPRIVAYRYLVFYSAVAQSMGDTTVRLAPDGITWTAPAATSVVPWGVVRRVEATPSGIAVTAGRPPSVLWLPARCFPTPDDLEMTGALAARYAADAAPVPKDEVEWPQTRQQRKSVMIFAFVWGGPTALVLLLLWYVTHTA